MIVDLAQFLPNICSWKDWPGQYIVLVLVLLTLGHPVSSEVRILPVAVTQRPTYSASEAGHESLSTSISEVEPILAHYVAHIASELGKS